MSQEVEEEPVEADRWAQLLFFARARAIVRCDLEGIDEWESYVVTCQRQVTESASAGVRGVGHVGIKILEWRLISWRVAVPDTYLTIFIDSDQHIHMVNGEFKILILLVGLGGLLPK